MERTHEGADAVGIAAPISVSIVTPSGELLLGEAQLCPPDGASCQALLNEAIAACAAAGDMYVSGFAVLVGPSGQEIAGQGVSGDAVTEARFNLVDGDVLTLVAKPWELTFHSALIFGPHDVNPWTISDDGKAATKTRGSDAVLQLVCPIPRSDVVCMTVVADTSFHHKQFGLARREWFPDICGEVSRFKHRSGFAGFGNSPDPSAAWTWGVDSGGEPGHQFQSTTDSKDLTGLRLLVDDVPCTLAVGNGELWLAVGEDVVGRIADGLPREEDLHPFVLCEVAAVTFTLVLTPENVERKLRDAIAASVQDTEGSSREAHDHGSRPT